MKSAHAIVQALVKEKVEVIFGIPGFPLISIYDVLYNTKHPYTQGLLAALPDTARHKQSLEVIKGSVPDGLRSVSGCSFHPRCPKVMDICLDQPPSLINVGEQEHSAACYLYMEETA